MQIKTLNTLNGGLQKTPATPDGYKYGDNPECPHCGQEMEEFHICPDSDTSEPLGGVSDL
jgi:hypothetical protein